MENVVQMIKDICLIVAAGIGSYVGLVGLSAWKRKIAYSEEYELSKAILISVYKIRQKVEIIRWPYREYTYKKNSEQENADVSEWRGLVDSYNKQWEETSKVMSEFGSRMLEAHVLFGEKVSKKVELVNTIVNELRFTTREYLDEINPENENRMERIDTDWYEEIRKILYSSTHEDEYSQRFEQAIKEIENVLKPYVEHIKR